MGFGKKSKDEKRNRKGNDRSRSPHQKENISEDESPHGSARQNTALPDKTRKEPSQELRRVPDYTAFKVVEGAPHYAGSDTVSQECSLAINVGIQSYQACSTHASISKSEEKQPKVDACRIEPEVISNTNGDISEDFTESESVYAGDISGDTTESESLYPGSSEDSNMSDASFCDADVSGTSVSSSDVCFERASTAQRSSTPKTRATMAHDQRSGQLSDTSDEEDVHNSSVSQNVINSTDEEIALNGSFTPNDTTCEPEEGDIEDELDTSEGDDNSNTGEPIDVVASGFSGSHSVVSTGSAEEQINRTVAELIKLQHRARAIHSHLARLNRYRA